MFLSDGVSNNFFIVTLNYRVCEGGELFYHITNKRHLSESQASSIMR